VGATAVAAIALAGCTVDEGAFESRVFVCDTAARDPHCGTDAKGAVMTCFPASQLDGTDFCTEYCDAPMSLLPAESAVCVQGNAKLEYCDPEDKTTAHGPCGRSDLGCLRTDITTDEGVCVTMQPCTNDVDCPNPVRSTCAATFLRDQLYPSHPDLHLDNLYCLQKNCLSGGASCAPGQSCLPKLIPAAANPPDICVPNCDSKGRCPPNHFCYKRLTNDANPAICIPGLLGFVCETDIDCLVGKCLSDNDEDPGLRLEMCMVDCTGDADCRRFDGPQGRFVCLSGRCVTPEAYRGSACNVDTDCSRDAGTICAYTHIPNPADPTDQGTCLRPCDDPYGPCTPRGGFGHTCVPFIDREGMTSPACYPGYFGFPCFTDATCVGDLICRGSDTTTDPPTPGICTTPCTAGATGVSDSDCDANRWSAGQGFCAEPFCAPLLDAGATCVRNGQCASRSCEIGAGQTIGACAGTP
jgi:hypothetical protein